MDSSEDIVITHFTRTAIGRFQGQFSTLSAIDLGAKALEGVLSESTLKKEAIDEVIMGCVLAPELGEGLTRAALLQANLPETTLATTLNTVCGSSMRAIQAATHQLLAGSSDIVIAGGMESMTNSPFLQDYDKANSMGFIAEKTAKKYGFSRQDQDEFVIKSLKRAQQAQEIGWFEQEITPITLNTPQGKMSFSKDEPPFSLMPEKIPTLKPIFSENGSITAASRAAIADGAACLVLMKAKTAKKHALAPIAKIQGITSVAQHPNWFTTTPIQAIETLLAQTHWYLEQVDLFEIHEAFAVITMATMKGLFLPPEKVNLQGGACALGNPIGASGARIVATLLSALNRHGHKRGIASLAVSGGEAMAIAIEVL